MTMATTPFCYFRTSTVLCSASPQPNYPKHDPTHQKVPASSSSNWWAPIFGWSSDPDYIQSTSNNGTHVKSGAGRDISGQSEREMGRSSRSKLGLGCFTEEKAKELRKKTMETSTFHDIMYHSAIASRLASDVSGSGRQDR